MNAMQFDCLRFLLSSFISKLSFLNNNKINEKQKKFNAKVEKHTIPLLFVEMPPNSYDPIKMQTKNPSCKTIFYNFIELNWKYLIQKSM